MSALTFTHSAAEHSECRAQPIKAHSGYCHKVHNRAHGTPKSHVTMHSVLPKLWSQPNVGLKTWLGLLCSPLARYTWETDGSMGEASVLALGTMVLVLCRVHETLQLSLVRELDLHQPASAVWILVDLYSIVDVT